ncbi:hypothetical protein V5E97_06315 [Singulisphaera sp. Ch08]|uniref:Uncharacterized protein n=1 Tax=Singulisphaera sp. Ch08 TaxID=3120278 RepID=A0AAU7CJE3_9BACT
MTDEEFEGEDKEEAALARFGLPARLSDRPEIIRTLEEEMRLDNDLCNESLMRLLCVQLFSLGMVEDSLRIWQAKSHNFDAFCGIDVQILCGAGLEQTKGFLSGSSDEEATKAFEYLREAEAAGDFNGFDVRGALEEHRSYYI